MHTGFARLGTVGLVVVVVAAALVAGATPAAAQRNGMLGIFFDTYGSQCSATLPPGAATQVYVVFLPDGVTRDGISGAEFRIDMQNAEGYTAVGWENLLDIGFGDPFGQVMNVASTECRNGVAIPLLSAQIYNASGGANAKFVTKVGDPPNAPTQFPCALVTLCDEPIYTSVCVETGKAVINPTGGTECGSNSESAEWSRIKQLYR